MSQTIPKTTQQWTVDKPTGFDGLKFTEDKEIPKLGDNDCLVKSMSRLLPSSWLSPV